ncbi:MAG: NUDIX hydrolase [Spirochaetota bacterium]
MKYCSNCGHSPLEYSIPKDDNRLRYHCSSCGTIYYSNPKIVVGCIPIYQDQVMLCKRSIEPRAGYWNLPAGFMENGETLQEGALREVWEEAETKVEIQRMHTVYHVGHANQIYFFFLAKMAKLEYKIGMETMEIQMFPLSDIPYEDLAFHSNVFTLQKYIENPDFQGIHYGKSTPETRLIFKKK